MHATELEAVSFRVSVFGLYDDDYDLAIKQSINR